jgi:hypothetical protein
VNTFPFASTHLQPLLLRRQQVRLPPRRRQLGVTSPQLLLLPGRLCRMCSRPSLRSLPGRFAFCLCLCCQQSQLSLQPVFPGCCPLLLLLSLPPLALRLCLQRLCLRPAALSAVLAAGQPAAGGAQAALQRLALLLPALLGGAVGCLGLGQRCLETVPLQHCPLHPCLQRPAAAAQLLAHRLQLLHLAQQRGTLLLQPAVGSRQLVCPLLQGPGWVSRGQLARQLAAQGPDLSSQLLLPPQPSRPCRLCLLHAVGSLPHVTSHFCLPALSLCHPALCCARCCPGSGGLLPGCLCLAAQLGGLGCKARRGCLLELQLRSCKGGSEGCLLTRQTLHAAPAGAQQPAVSNGQLLGGVVHTCRGS